MGSKLWTQITFLIKYIRLILKIIFQKLTTIFSYIFLAIITHYTINHTYLLDLDSTTNHWQTIHHTALLFYSDLNYNYTLCFTFSMYIEVLVWMRDSPPPPTPRSIDNSGSVPYHLWTPSPHSAQTIHIQTANFNHHHWRRLGVWGYKWNDK